MTLTNSEEQRLQAVEQKITVLSHLLKGTGSKNQLNRLYTLCQEEMKGLEKKMTELESQLNNILLLARKLQ